MSYSVAFLLGAFSIAGAYTNPPGTQWWAPQTTGSSATFKSVSFGNKDTGWVVGVNGTILKSVNGGNAWTSQSASSAGVINAVYAWNGRVAMLATQDGRVINTTSGGESWLFQSGNRGQSLIGLQMVSATVAFALGPDSVFKTTNGGGSWSGVGLALSNNARAFHFSSATTGWTVGLGGRILKTMNGGSVWTVFTDSTVTTNLRAVHFVNDNLGWVVGDTGLVRKTTDGGASWTTQPTGSSGAFHAVRFVDANTGWIAGAGIYKTTNGGSTWINQTADSMSLAAMPTSLHAFDTLTAIGAGATVVKCPATLTVTYPNGGEKWLGGVPIRYAASNIAQISLAYSADNGLTWTPFASSSDATPGFDGWAAYVPVGTQYKIRVSRAGSHQSDESDAPFTIAALNIAAPADRASWRSGSTQAITWTSSGLGPLLRVEYSLNYGKTWIKIADSVATGAGSLSWTLPQGVFLSGAQIRIVDKADTNLARIVSSFDIRGLYVTQPASGDVVYRSNPYTLAWSGSDVGLINIQYSPDNGATWTTISPAAGVNGAAESFVWNVPANQPFTTQARLRLQDKADPNNIYNLTEYAFVMGGISLTSPNGGEIWLRESPHPITWTSVGEAQTVRLQYSLNNGTSWTNLTANPIAVSPGTYNWSIPGAATNTAQARIRIYDNARQNTVYDVSDSAFSITSLTAVEASPASARFALHTGDAAHIRFSLPAEEANVRLEAIDAKGILVATLVDGPRSAGTHQVGLAGLAPGIYTYRLRAGSKEIRQRAARVR